MAHTLAVRTITSDGILVAEDTDFAEDAMYDWFEEIARQAESGEVVQLIDLSDDRVIEERLIPVTQF